MDRIASEITDNILELGVIDQQDITIYRYGMEVLLLSLLEIGSILCLAIMVGNFFETLVYFISFIPLRLFAGGYHASTRLRCYLLSLCAYVVFTVLLSCFSKEQHLLFSISVFIAIFSVITIFLFAPVIHANRYCEESERIHFGKVSHKIVIFDVIIIFVSYFIQMKIFAFIIALGLLSEMLAILLTMKTKESVWIKNG